MSDGRGECPFHPLKYSLETQRYNVNLNILVDFVRICIEVVFRG